MSAAVSAAPHVLLVDDSPLVTDALGVLLAATGHRVTTADSVAAAITAARAGCPDVLLLDLTLPDGDGLAVLAALDASDGDGAACPPPRPVTFALTGHDDPATEARCLAAGCRGVLVKPVPLARLLAALREATAAP